MLCGDLNGKEIQKRGINVSVWMIHFAVQRKLTQQCKATKLQFKKALDCLDGLPWWLRE